MRLGAISRQSPMATSNPRKRQRKWRASLPRLPFNRKTIAKGNVYRGQVYSGCLQAGSRSQKATYTESKSIQVAFKPGDACKRQRIQRASLPGLPFNRKSLVKGNVYRGQVSPGCLQAGSRLQKATYTGSKSPQVVFKPGVACKRQRIQRASLPRLPFNRKSLAKGNVYREQVSPGCLQAGRRSQKATYTEGKSPQVAF